MRGVTAAANSPLRILLVEDSDLLLGVIGEMIDEIDGVELSGAAQGETAALAQLNGTKVDLAIVDLELAEGSGLGLLRQLRSDPGRFGGSRVVVFSNHAHAAIQRQCRALGAEAFFDKSEGVEALIDFVEDAAREAAAGSR
ncbi:MAG: response regulator transcription factor [Rhodocyclaceae bacterium]|nr:response regulator transcription factor [Rhodocyclaceae bacterium]